MAETFSNGASCSGNCSACGEDCDRSTVTLTLDDDSELECSVISIFPAQDKHYIALLPLDENGENHDGEVYLYRYYEENGNPQLANIEDDEEYEIASDAFEEMLDNAEFDELVDGEDL